MQLAQEVVTFWTAEGRKHANEGSVENDSIFLFEEGKKEIKPSFPQAWTHVVGVKERRNRGGVVVNLQN